MKRRKFFRAVGGALAAAGFDFTTHPGGEETVTCKIRSRDPEGEAEVTRRVPSSLDDPLWTDLVSSREDIHALAMQSFIVKAQANARGRFREMQAPEAAQEAFAEYFYQPRRRNTKHNLVAEAGTFSAEQIAYLRKVGIKVV